MDDKTNHIFIRIDHAEKIEPIQEDLIEAILELESSFDAIIISDYRKGFLTEESISKLAKAKCPTFLDTKKKLGLWAKDIDFININKGEFEASEYEIIIFIQKSSKPLALMGQSIKGQIIPSKRSR